MPLSYHTYLVVDNVRSALNVGALLRTADGLGIAKVYVCGITPKPDHPKVLKTALGAQNSVPWEYHAHTWRLVEKLKREGIRIVALEQTSRSIELRRYHPKFPFALIVGNEVTGISESILRRVDDIIDIPMRGKKESLNVAVAAGIAMYQLIP